MYYLAGISFVILTVIAPLGILLWHWRELREHKPSLREKIIAPALAVLWAAGSSFRLFTRFNRLGPDLAVWFIAVVFLLLILLAPPGKRNIPLACLALFVCSSYFIQYVLERFHGTASGWQRILLRTSLPVPVISLLVCLFYVVRFGLARRADPKHGSGKFRTTVGDHI
jgi:hypothetical protein